MNRLIKSNFARLFKSFVFRLGLIASAGFAVYTVMERYLDILRDPGFYARIDSSFTSVEGMGFRNSTFVVFVCAVFIALFTGTEYSDKTMRNKLIIGHDRPAVFTANFMTCAVGAAMVFAVYFTFEIVLGSILLGSHSITADITAKLLFSQLMSVIAFSALVNMLSMLITNKAVSSVVILLLTGAMLLGGSAINSRLTETEYYSEQYAAEVNPDNGMIERLDTRLMENPRYISGVKRGAYTVLSDALPMNQILRTSELDDDKIDVMAIYSLAFVMILNAVGIVIFRKKDIS